MGEEREVVAHEHVFAANGMKLIAKGTRINRSQCERLNLHKLRVPLDRVLATENPVNAAQLANDASKMLAADMAMARLAQRTGDPLGFRQGLAALALPRPLAFRLTVMREKRSGLFHHSLRTALITHSIASRLGLSNRDKQDLLLAALCHDIGEMHTDPALLASGHQVTPEQRRFIHVHPITSYVVLRDLPGVSSPAMQAVLHHHERLDGSGYPYGLRAGQIHPLAGLLCVAEVTEALVRRSEMQRLDVLLRLNQRRFEPAAVGALRQLLRTDPNASQDTPSDHDATVQLTRVAEVLGSWPALCDRLDAQAASPELAFLKERMAMLRSLVLQSGINPDDLEVLLELAREDSVVLNELRATLDELDWLMADIANEIERRTTALDVQSRSAVEELVVLLRAA
ncbi:HD-GYP domain-containing protein [Aromatoleum buckelii]|uniref:HD domain-containing protein n=1 Tax=Aromatoleum buckelii TaxID=200254 RepID=A0ABX1MW42_9RHOO|nr:HD domain-containing phosphohydrolase [Aromatoleum buckelii]MCK0512935.1 HD domain-containing protein [Aromatoleum buckelii]